MSVGRAVATKLRLGAVLVGAVVAATACGGSGGPGPTSRPPSGVTSGVPSHSTSTSTSASASASRTSVAPPSLSPRPPAPTRAQGCVERTLAGMSTAQRVGQLFMVGVNSAGVSRSQLAVLRRHHIGSIMLMGHTSVGARKVLAGVERAQSASPTIRGHRVGMLVSTDQEGGQVQVLSGPGFSTIPSAVAQGGSSTARLQQRAAEWGRQLRAAGVTVDLAPVTDIVPPNLTRVNQPIGVLSREYGNNAATVARQSSAFVRGLGQAHVYATLKHFPGLGRVVGNTDFSANITDRVTSRNGDYQAPYRAGFAAGARFVLVSLATYARIDPGHQAVFSSTLLRGVLRDHLGFRGVVMSDDLGKAIAVRSIAPGQRAVGFLSAGGDLVLTDDPSTAGAMASAVVARAERDAAFRSGVDASARRVLDAKLDNGLLSCSR